MRFFSVATFSGLFILAQVASAAPSLTDSSSLTTLFPRNGCSGGVHVCCGFTSVGCSGNVCKACCGSTCGCFYERGSTCPSDPNVTPCVDVTKPDFAMTNGKCVASSTRNTGSTGSSGSSKSGSSTSSACSRLPAGLKHLFGCQSI